MLVEGTVLDNTYQIISKIGSGGTGDVYLAYHLRLEKYVVVKKVKDNFVGKVNVRAEVDILKKIKHSFLPQVYDFVQMGTTVYTVMEYVEGNNLDEYISSGYIPDEQTVIKWLRQLCEVLEYLHTQEPAIIHSDIKPENIMITTNGNVCLIDFNISLDSDDSSQISGISLPYASPEQYEKATLFLSRMYHGHIILDGRSDMYSLAASFYYVMTGMKPSNPYDYPMPLSKWDLPYSEGLVYIVEKAMSIDINNRYTDMHEMRKAVNSMYKHTKIYRIYLLGNIISSVFYMSAICFGIWCLMHGFSLEISENYNKATDKFFSSYSSGNYENAIEEGDDILNNKDFNKILSKNKDEKIDILYTIGQCYFENGDYINALTYYSEAVSKSSNIYENFDYYRGYIVTLIRCGYVDQAENEIGSIKKESVSKTEIDLIEAEILMYKEKYSEGLQLVDSVLNENLDTDMELHLLVLASEGAKQLNQYTKQIEYLEKARKIDGNISVLRKLGNAYMSMATNGKISQTTQMSYVYKAEECYQTISQKPYSSLNDQINLAICYRALGKYLDSIQLLKELESTSTDYRICMHLAFAYDKNNDVVNAKTYVKKALDQYNHTPESEKESDGSDNIQSLMQLKEKYN